MADFSALIQGVSQRYHANYFGNTEMFIDSSPEAQTLNVTGQLADKQLHQMRQFPSFILWYSQQIKDVGLIYKCWTLI